MQHAEPQNESNRTYKFIPNRHHLVGLTQPLSCGAVVEFKYNNDDNRKFDVRKLIF